MLISSSMMAAYPADMAALTLDRVYLEATSLASSTSRYRVIRYQSAISAPLRFISSIFSRG